MQVTVNNFRRLNGAIHRNASSIQTSSALHSLLMEQSNPAASARIMKVLKPLSWLFYDGASFLKSTQECKEGSSSCVCSHACVRFFVVVRACVCPRQLLVHWRAYLLSFTGAWRHAGGGVAAAWIHDQQKRGRHRSVRAHQHHEPLLRAECRHRLESWQFSIEACGNKKCAARRRTFDFVYWWDGAAWGTSARAAVSIYVQLYV